MVLNVNSSQTEGSESCNERNLELLGERKRPLPGYVGNETSNGACRAVEIEDELFELGSQAFFQRGYGLSKSLHRKSSCEINMSDIGVILRLQGTKPGVFELSMHEGDRNGT